MALVLLAGARDADAYVRYRIAGTDKTFAWTTSCLPLPIVVYPGTFSQMTTAEITGAVTAAAAAWSAGANPCTFMELSVTVASGPAPRAGNDGRNTIVLRDTSWCALDATGACVQQSSALYDPAAPAATSVVARSSTGQIVDADIEINAFHFQWADRAVHPELTDRYDLQNVLTHELGHLLGLDHSCFVAAGGARPNDHTGEPAPDCATAPAEVVATTMFPSAVAGDLERRTLEADDREGVCAIYPAAATPCAPGVSCMCHTNGGQDAGAGSPDAAPADAGAPDAGTPGSGGGGGCGIAADGRRSQRLWPVLLCLGAALAAIVRRRRVLRR